MQALIDDELTALEAQVADGSLPEGVIHADLFPDNVLFVDNEVSGLIDFYFACSDALAYDLAVTLNAWCFEADGSFNLTKGRALIAGYQAKRQLEPAERAAMPLLCRGAALRFLLTRLYDWLNPDPAALVRPKDPREFARRLRFHRNVQQPRRRTDCDRGARRDLHRRRVQRQSRPRRLGGDPALRASTRRKSPAASGSPPTTAWS